MNTLPIELVRKILFQAQDSNSIALVCREWYDFVRSKSYNAKYLKRVAKEKNISLQDLQKYMLRPYGICTSNDSRFIKRHHFPPLTKIVKIAVLAIGTSEYSISLDIYGRLYIYSVEILSGMYIKDFIIGNDYIVALSPEHLTVITLEKDGNPDLDYVSVRLAVNSLVGTIDKYIVVVMSNCLSVRLLEYCIEGFQSLEKTYAAKIDSICISGQRTYVALGNLLYTHSGLAGFLEHVPEAIHITTDGATYYLYQGSIYQSGNVVTYTGVKALQGSIVIFNSHHFLDLDGDKILKPAYYYTSIISVVKYKRTYLVVQKKPVR